MDNIYTAISSIPTSAVGASAKIRLTSIFCLMQDAASVHASGLGVGFEDLYPIHRTFILSRIQMKICGELPVWGESLVLQTWPRGLERLFAYRDFELSKEGEMPFLKATSSWLMIDTEHRRPVRPQDMFTGITPRSVRVMDDDAPQKLGWDEETKPFETRNARASDLDLNGHVNNTRYIDWITDLIAMRHGLSAQISEICINYLSEVHMGEHVNIGMREDADGSITIQGEASRRNFCAKVRMA
ncbi:MAG: acyl-ACP thioesterase domain-containing protein [Opitutales bacterium]|jgi:acyl-ACP thioesterase